MSAWFRKFDALITCAFLASVAAFAPDRAYAQTDALRDEILMHLDASMDKFIAVAKAMPAEKYTWSPGGGLMQVGHVFTHVAYHNYIYLQGNIGVAPPAGVKLADLEAVREKEQVIRSLEDSREYVHNQVRGMPAALMTQRTKLAGRDVQRWAVLMQMVTHMSEHLGQAIAYARMNGIMPPWCSGAECESPTP